MAIRPEFRPLLGFIPRLAYRRPWAISLSLLILLTSVSYASEEPPEDSVADLMARGPHAVLDVNPAGKVIPKPQKGAAANKFAQSIATSMEAAKAEGYFEVGPDFSVTLTPNGREFALRTAAENSFGCDEVKSVSADWLGIHLDLESTCTQEELQDRMGIDMDEVRRDEAEAGPVSSSGFAPPTTPRPTSDSALSDLFGCFLTADTFFLGGSLFMIGFAVASPATGWVAFWLRWGGFSSAFFGAATNWVQNCTQVIRAEATVKRWGATFGVKCTLRWYSDYRYSSSYGYYVPVYIRYGC